MAYAQWAVIKVQPKGCTVKLESVSHSSGKFYSGSKDNEVPPKDIEGTVIYDAESYSLSACGRENAPEGTTGKFRIYDGNVLVGEYNWDCPWGKKKNISNWEEGSDNYIVTLTGANLDSGALGNVNLMIKKLTD